MEQLDQRLAQFAYRLGRAPLLGCLPRNRDTIHRIHEPNDWGGLQRFARKQTTWLPMPMVDCRAWKSGSHTAGSVADYRFDL